ncbi:MAG: TonB family protein [Acidobacteria bacterium]|nr:TonB family protein [Acidobacteriota bacterium]
MNRPMTLGLMAEPQRSWKVFVTSYGAQAIGVFLLVQLAMLKPVQMATHKAYEYMSLTAPAPEPQPAETVQVRPQPPRLAPPQVIQEPVIETARLRVPEQIRKPQAQEVPQPVPIRLARAMPEVPAMPVVKPVAPVITGGFSAGSSSVATIKAPVQQVQTGGFGDPNGVPAQASPNARGATIAQTGHFDMPAGGGYGNGAGGTRGIRGTVASAGFGNGIATQTPVTGARGNGVLQQAGFSETHAAAAHVRTAEIQPTTIPVEIISKPKPAYTEEARQLHLEGEVLVEVVFTAAGQVHALRVVRGLGHGLDEAALRAAEQIHYKPAQRDGRAVDSTAVLHVVFQIA